MGSVTIRRIDETVKSKLRLRAVRHGRSLEEELRRLLIAVANEDDAPKESLYTAICKHIDPIGGLDLGPQPHETFRPRVCLDE